MTAPPAPKKARKSETFREQEDSIVCEDDESDSPYVLYFVKLPDGDATELEMKNLVETFEFVKESKIMPEWIDSESVERLQTSDDFFVFPCFRGKAFRKVQALKLKVFGPPIVLECIEEQKVLPSWNHPTYSSVFEGAKISFTGIDPEKQQELRRMIGYMGGIQGNLYHETTHLVAGKAERTEKYKAAVNNSIKLMKKEWIEDMWKTSQTTLGKFSALIKDAIDSYELRVFEGLEMAVTSIDGTDRNNLIQLVEEHGGRIPGNMSRSKCSHLISDKTNGQKYIKATEWKTVRIVQTRWVRKCIDLGYLIDETKYHPKYLSGEHVKCSTPKKDTTVVESVPDVSSIAGPGGKLSVSSFNMSSLATPLHHSYRQQNSFISMASTSNVASSTIRRNDTTSRRTESREIRIAQQNTPVARIESVPLVRYPTTQTMLPNDDAFQDPIDDLRKQIDRGHSDLFENELFYMCGVDESRIEKWVRFLNETGATRAPKIESATHVVVVSPNQQERKTIKKYIHQEDIAIVTVQWVAECIKKRQIVPAEGYEWREEELFSPTSSTQTTVPYNMLQQSIRSDLSVIFSNHTFCVHPSLGNTKVAHMKLQIEKSGGRIENNPERAEFVVFGHSAPIHELISFDTVVTDFYIETCIDNAELLPLASYPLFVPLPRPPLKIFDHMRFVLRNRTPFVRDYVQLVIETNGGVVVEKMDSRSFEIILDTGRIEKQEFKSRTADFSWIVASVSQCRLQPIGDHLYEENSKPLAKFQRNDDVWVKSVRERDTTEEMMEEVEDRHRVTDQPVKTDKNTTSNQPSPYENPYFHDLRQPYRMNLQLDGVSEYINNMESPSRDTQDTLTTSRVGSILRKAVEITGRRETAREKDNRMPDNIPPKQVAENRRTVSSTPVMVRDLDRSMRFMPMDESFDDQNQQHDDLNRHYASHPHFLLSVSNLEQKNILQLQEAIKELGGHIEKEFNRDVTHLITSNMQRTPKVLSSIAAGRWCLTPEYIVKSSEAGRWLDEYAFEWCYDRLPPSADNETLKQRDNRKILESLVSVCSLWRTRVASMPITCSVRMENRHNGAFSDWCVVIHQEDKKTQQISSILEAGGAVVHSITDYIEISTLTPNRVFAYKDFEWNSQSAKMLKAENIPIYIFEVIYEYLIDRENLDYSKFLHPVYKKV